MIAVKDDNRCEVIVFTKEMKKIANRTETR